MSVSPNTEQPDHIEQALITFHFWGEKNPIFVFLLVPDLYWITEDKINVIILYLYLDWHKHTDVIVAVFFHAYWKIILKKLQDITWEI